MLPLVISASRLRALALSFGVLWLSSLLLFREPLSALISLSSRDERYTHAIVIPFLSLGLILLRRRKVFLHAQPCLSTGIPAIAVGVAPFYCLGLLPLTSLSPHLSLFLAVFSLVSVWMSAFVFCFGKGAFREAFYPLALLLLMIPVPPALVEVAEIALQRATAEGVDVLFKAAATPVFREGSLFSLPGVTIEVARACSGIRSSIALLIAALVLNHLFLQSSWRRVLVIILTVLLAVVKNAIRITTLAWLGVYVSKDYLFGDLHHRGGPVFFLFSFGLLVPLLMILQKSEAGLSVRPEQGSNSKPVDSKGNV